MAEEFQITLDSHFITSLILNKYYNQTGSRVARFSLNSEINHKFYYDRLGFIRVYAKDFTPTNLKKNESRKKGGSNSSKINLILFVFSLFIYIIKSYSQL